MRKPPEMYRALRMQNMAFVALMCASIEANYVLTFSLFFRIFEIF